MYKISELPNKQTKEDLKDFSIITQILLNNRGIKTKNEALSFFNKDFDNLLDPLIFEDLDKAVDRIYKAQKNNEVIGIYADYDCDGIPSAVILYEALKMIGVENVEVYIPNRNEEGFGLNEKGIKNLLDKNVTLFITVDCGTSDKDMVEKLDEGNVDVIIIDHHKEKDIPNVFALINSAIEDKSHPMCAAGCVYKVVQALIHKSENINNGFEKWFLDLVCISTLADCVPLVGDNRLLSHYGLIVLKKTKRKGLLALMKKLRLSRENLTEEDITFSIAPRINACSRIGNPLLAFNLLIEKDFDKSYEMVLEIEKLNNKRKTEVTQMTKKVREIIKNKDKNNKIWVFGDRKWKPSLVGLIASKISEEYEKTVFVWGYGGEKIKGSVRSSIDNIFELMSFNKDEFIEFGGHDFAGGFSLEQGKEITLEKKLNKNLPDDNMERDPIAVDALVQLRDVEEIYREVNKFRPFGIGNESPLFIFKDVRIKNFSKFGKTKLHSKYTFEQNNFVTEAISFFNEPFESDDFVDVLGRVEFDSFFNKPRIRIEKFV